MKLIAIILLCAFAFLSTGCAAVEKAQAIYEARAEQAEEAYNAWQAAADRLEEARGDARDFERNWQDLNKRVDDAEAELAAAVATGDVDAIKAANKTIEQAKNQLTLLKDRGELVLAALKTAQGYAKEAGDVYNASKDVVKAAAQDLEDAKSASDYLGTILGWFGLGVTTLLTGGKALQQRSSLKATRRERDDAESAIRRVYKTNEAELGETDLATVKATNVKYMTLAEREAARRATR